MKFAAFSLLFFLVFPLFSGRTGAAQQNAPISLSLAETARLAEARSRTVQAANARITAAEARVSAASRLPNATLGLAQPYGSSATGGFDEGVFLSQTVELPGKVGPRKAAATQERTAAFAGGQGTRLDTVLSAQLAYIECLRADSEAAQAQISLDTAKKFTETAQIQFQAGDVPRSAVLRSQIEQARTEQILSVALTDRENRYLTLRSLLALPLDTPLTLTDALKSDDKIIALDAARTAALTRRPELLSARALVAARQADVRAAKSQRLPDVIVEGRRATLDPHRSGESSIRFGVAFPLFDNGRIGAETRAADAANREQTALLQEAERTTLLEVETAFREREQARLTVTTFEGATGRLAKAKELLEMAQIGYTRGGNGSLEIIDAQRTYQSEQIEYLRALAAYRSATAQLERATGGTL